MRSSWTSPRSILPFEPSILLCFDHAREDCPFEDPITPIYHATNLDRDGKPKPFRAYRNELADRRWLTSTDDQIRTMIEVVSP